MSVFLFIFIGCYSVKVKAPSGQEVQLVSYTENAKEVKTKKVWYILWGLVPLSDNTTESELVGVKKASVTTSFTFVDILISIFTGIITISPRTVEVNVYE